MNINEFEVLQNKPYGLTLMYELYEDSEFDKKAARILSSSDIFAESKMNGEVFNYNITNKMSLRKYLSCGVDKYAIIRMVRRFMEAQIFCEERGISEEYLVLDTDLILVDKNTKEISMMAVPATNHGLVLKPLRAFIREVIASAVYDQEENLDYVGRMLSFVNTKKNFVYVELNDLLISLENGHFEKSISVRQVSIDKAPMVENAAFEEPVVEESIEEESMAEVPVTEIEESKSELIFEEADTVAADIPMIVLPSFDDEDKLDGISDISVKQGIVEPELDMHPMIDNIVVGADVHENLKVNEVVEELHIEDPYEVKRDAFKESEVIHISKAYLVRAKTQEIVSVDGDEFKIGKIYGMADYLLDDNPAVSRMHAIIHQIQDAYYVCDNYSTNHTYLNNEMLEPGKNYLLISGAKVRFANDEFTFLIK